MYRQVLHSIFAYACKPESFDLPANPVASTEKRRQSGPGAIATFTVEELRALEEATAKGKHRDEPKYKIGEKVRAEWRRIDEQDATLFMVAAFTGLRQGELHALKWRHIDFTVTGSSLRTPYQTVRSRQRRAGKSAPCRLSRRPPQGSKRLLRGPGSPE